MSDIQAEPRGSTSCELRFDADAPLQAVLEAEGCPLLLHDALAHALSWQSRNRHLIRRALVSPTIAPQWYAALLALGARVLLEKDTEQWEVPLDEAMQRSEADLVALRISTEGLSWGAAHVARTPADEPIVAAAAAVAVEGGIVRKARVALTGVWPSPVGLASAASELVGGPLDEDRIRVVAAAVRKEVQPRADFLGSEQYRRAMAGVLTRRALEGCLRPANEA